MVGEADGAELRAIAGEYLATAWPTFRRAREALALRDPVALAEAAHAGKGSALNVCAGPLAASWKRLEAASTTLDFEQLGAYVDDLEARFDELRADVESTTASATERAL
jgi:HPt (histidine-containing phosphotransfer) domain-containing protein